MQTPATSNTSKPMSEAGSGSTPTIRLRPWEIAELLICKRGEQLIEVEQATDTEFQSWLDDNGIPVDDNGVEGWTFDDRCMVINYALSQGATLEFVDGTTLPAELNSSEEEAH